MVNRGLAPSREKAKTRIMEGNVFVENEREDKAGDVYKRQILRKEGVLSDILFPYA